MWTLSNFTFAVWFSPPYKTRNITAESCTTILLERKLSKNKSHIMKLSKNKSHIMKLKQLAFTYLGERVIMCGGCEVAVAVRTRCRWVISRACGEMLYGKRFDRSCLQEQWKSNNSASDWRMVHERKWECCEGQKGPWWEQCVEYSSKIGKELRNWY